MPADSLYLMSPTEIAWGYLVGHDGRLPRPRGRQPHPREALEDVVRGGLRRPPCGVAFSGGRDSSLVLAVATHVARRDGLPDPVPVTRRFPDVAAADETVWQELVVRHLGLTEWERLEFRDELDVVGPVAAPVLREHGVLWPPSFASDVALLGALTGGTLLDGEGGDEVLGVESHRIAPVTRLLRHPRPLNRWRVRHALGAVAPARIRVPRLRRNRFAPGSEWLRPDAWAAFMDAVDEAEATQPLAFSASVRMVPRRRTQLMAGRNVRILAAGRDVVAASPLIDPRFVTAIAAHGGVLGRGDRTSVLRSLAADLLPDDVLARTTKATFTVAYLGEPARTFARTWDGAGVDTRLVDPERLRKMWLSDRPPAPTSALLQSAWLAAEGAGPAARHADCGDDAEALAQRPTA